MWTCVNGHDVRDGMFACPKCGADEVADPDRSAATATPPSRDRVRVAARKEILNRLSTGVLLVLVAAVLGAVVPGAAADGGAGPIATSATFVAYVVGLVGAGFVLVAVVGHGVRLGVEAARTERSG